MNTLTPLHLEHLDYALKRLSNALLITSLREQPPYDMQPLIHCLDILDKGVRRTAAFMTGEWPEPKIVHAQAALEKMDPQNGAEAPVIDVSRYEAELEKEAAKSDDSNVSPRSNPEKPSVKDAATTEPTQGTAAGYFSSLPWQNHAQPPDTQTEKHLLASELEADLPRYEAELGKEAAKGFFSNLPWEGEEAAKSDDSSVSPRSNSEKPSITDSTTTEPTQGTAAGYFSSLPWQNQAQPPDTQTDKHLLASESEADLPRSEAELGKEAAKVFFSGLPWEGEETVRADDSSVSPSETPKRQSITDSATTEPIQGTAAGYFSSLPWQHQKQTSRTDERAPLHIQSGASALQGKQSVTTGAALNPILAATHSAIETARSASSDNHADNNSPQEDKHGLDKTVEKPTIIFRKQNERSSSDNEPAQTPQAKDDL